MHVVLADVFHKAVVNHAFVDGVLVDDVHGIVLFNENVGGKKLPQNDDVRAEKLGLRIFCRGKAFVVGLRVAIYVLRAV